MAAVMSLWLIRVLPFFMMMWMVNSQNGVSIRLMRQELTSGISQVCLSDIGEQPSRANATVGVPDSEEGPALVCVTNNSNCCRAVDNPNGGPVGEWTINGFPVPGINANPSSRFYRNRGTGLVRINYRPSAEGADPPLVLTGEYCCMIPDMSGVTQRLCVNVTLNGITDPPTDPSTVTVSPQLTPCPPTTDLLGAILGPLVGVIVVLVIVIHAWWRKNGQWNRPEGNIQTNDLTNHSSAIESENIDLKTNQAYGNIKHGETVANLVTNPSYESVPPPIAQQSVEYDYIPDLLHGNMPASNSGVGTEDSRLTSVVYEAIPA